MQAEVFTNREEFASHNVLQKLILNLKETSRNKRTFSYIISRYNGSVV